MIARAGIASRRQCEGIITEGRVTVDGEVVRDVACRVDAQTQRITVDGELLPSPKPVHFAFHKPRGVVCTNADDEKRPRVIDYFRGQSSRLFTVGRLDEESEGLILVTNDGTFSQHIAHPRHEVTKTYEVTVIGRVSGEELAKIRKGVWISDGKTKVHGAFVRKKTPRFTILHIVLAEGRNREVRRIFARIGFRLRRLRRIAIGPVELRDLKPGQHRPLRKNELRALTDVDGTEPTPSS